MVAEIGIRDDHRILDQRRACVVENSRSRPRSSVTLATTATRMAGAAAMTENRPRCARGVRSRPGRTAGLNTATPRADQAEQQQPLSRRSQQKRDDNLMGRRIGVSPASTTNVVEAPTAARDDRDAATIPTIQRAWRSGVGKCGLGVVACFDAQMTPGRGWRGLRPLTRILGARKGVACRH